VNPDVEEARKLREWYDSEGRGATTQAAGEGLMIATPGGGLSRSSRETLKDIQAEGPSSDDKPTYHNIIATCAFVSSNQTFYYMAHPESNRKVFHVLDTSPM
jgi:replication factor A1